MSKAVTKNTEAAITTATSGLSATGMDNTDLQIPVAYLFQGTAKERKEYPDAKPGDLINKLTGELIASRNFMPIHVYKSWAKFEKGKGLVYVESDKSRVPAEDLEWIDGQPPAANETLNWYLMFEGMDYPVVFRFKKTSIKSGKRLYSLETLNRSGKGSGLYELSHTEDEGPEGPYLVPQVRPLGDPSAELVDMANRFRAAITGGTATEVGDDDVPF